jgi:hypothetical protein
MDTKLGLPDRSSGAARLLLVVRKTLSARGDLRSTARLLPGARLLSSSSTRGPGARSGYPQLVQPAAGVWSARELLPVTLTFQLSIRSRQKIASAG